ncbi:tetratricopeptide repeat protein [Polluticoccus soli]|uniref:tetratricopeptide repeat protein n=1 Tax=Polluticoccus soli TaxID=3034150 RepID=UPI0023E1B05E|nr:tetratricopeptide repeat protein [Flavipsychrobacter sp. JY13-12]
MLRETTLLLVLSFSVFVKQSAAQNIQQELDSLTTVLKSAKQDTAKVSLLVAISRNYYRTDPAKGVECGKKALALANELDYDYGVMTANNAIGRCYAVQDDLTEALQHFQATLTMARKLNDEEFTGNALLAMGLVYSSNHEPQKALDYFQQARKIYETLGIPRVSLVINGIGNCYMYMNDYEPALNYFLQGIKIEEQLKSATPLLATMLANAGGASLGLKKYNEALSFLFKALELQKNMGNTSSTASTLNNIGNAYLAMGKNPSNSFPDSLRNKEVNFQKALHYEKQALAVCEELGIRDKLVDVYATTSNIYRMQGNLSEGLVYFDKYDALKDTLARENNEKEFAKIEAEFRVQKMTDSLKYLATLNEHEAAERKLERNGSIVVLSLASIISLLLVNRQKLKQMQGRKMAEAERMRAEDMAKQQLADFTQSIQEKNALIEKFSAEITRYQASAYNELPEQDSSLEELQSSVILTEEQWVNFQSLFDKVHQGYIGRTKEKYPALTAAELRFIVLSRLELSNKEMAAMLGVSLEAVRTNKHRLLKKLSLPEGVSLYDTVHAI